MLFVTPWNFSIVFGIIWVFLRILEILQEGILREILGEIVESLSSGIFEKVFEDVFLKSWEISTYLQTLDMSEEVIVRSGTVTKSIRRTNFSHLKKKKNEK